MPIPVFYKGVAVREPLFLDIFVEEKMVVELKATEKDYPVYHVQLLTYLRLLGVKSGLLINFGKQHLKDGIYRVVNESTKTPALSLTHTR
jgi:GxxExxY protein